MVYKQQKSSKDKNVFGLKCSWKKGEIKFFLILFWKLDLLQSHIKMYLYSSSFLSS